MLTLLSLLSFPFSKVRQCFVFLKIDKLQGLSDLKGKKELTRFQQQMNQENYKVIKNE